MPATDNAVMKQFRKWQETHAKANVYWDRTDRELRKLIRLAKIGRKASTVVPISESRGIEIVNQFRGEEKVFAPAFARKWKVREVALRTE